MKKKLGDHHFTTDDDVMNAVDHYLRPKMALFYIEGIRLLYDHWTKCVNVGAYYVESVWK